MNLKQLEVFIQVVKLSSFSKAADTIYLSQSTISAHISSLEQELGTQLLIRSTKEVYPTKAGVDFFVHAQNLITMKDQAIQSVTKFSQDSKGRIDILSSSVPAQYLLPEIVAQFHRIYPNIVLNICQTDSKKVAENLAGFQYDIGIVGTKITSNKYNQTPIYDDDLAIIVPNYIDLNDWDLNNNLAGFIKSKPFVMREDGSGTKDELELFLRNIGISSSELRTSCYFSDTQSVIHAVSCGAGISFVSKVAADVYSNANLVKVIDIDNKLFSRKFYLLLKKDMILSPIQKLFTNHLSSFYKYKV